MRWTKTVLLFQAVVTLLFGLIFFTQVMSLDTINESTLDENTILPFADDKTSATIDIKQRYHAAAYILMFISLIELVIIIKLII